MQIIRQIHVANFLSCHEIIPLRYNTKKAAASFRKSAVAFSCAYYVIGNTIKQYDKTINFIVYVHNNHIC